MSSSPQKSKFTSFDKGSSPLNSSGISVTPYDDGSRYAGVQYMGKTQYALFAKVGVSPIHVDPNVEYKRVEYEVESFFYEGMDKFITPLQEWAKSNPSNRFGAAINKNVAFEGMCN
jgi:hypothetical protein